MNLDKNAYIIIIYEGKEYSLPKDDIEKLGALNYRCEKIAMYFEMPNSVVERELADENSELSYYFRRGQIMCEAREQFKLLDLSATGDIPSGKRLEELRRDKNFEFSKLDIFGSIKDKVKFSALEDFLQSGGSVKLSNNEALYLECLRLIESINYHYGDRKTLALLQKPPYNLSYTKAKDMICEAENLFYTDKNRNKKALRNKRAEMILDAATVVRQNAKTSRDFEIYSDMLAQASKLQELDKEDPQVLPAEVYRKEMRIFMLEPEQVGMLGIDRNEVAAQIDRIAIPETSKMRLRYDAFIEDVVPLKSYLDEQPTKD